MLICAVVTWVLTWSKKIDGVSLLDIEGSGLAWESHYIYIIFALTTFFIEKYLYADTLNKIKHLLPEISFSKSKSCTTSLSNKINNIILSKGGPLYKQTMNNIG